MPESNSNDVDIAIGIRRLVWLAIANLIVMVVLTAALVFLMIPRLERAVATTERVEARFQSFADDLQPVLAAGAGKSIEAIQKMDADQLAETATESSDATIRELGQRAKRFLKGDAQESEPDEP